METALIALLALFIGFGTAKFFTKSRNFEIELRDLELLKAEKDRLESEKLDIEAKNNELTTENQQLKTDFALVNQRLDLINDLRKVVADDFTSIANKIIKEEQSDLREQNKEVLELKIKPLTENLEQFRKRLEEFNTQGQTNTQEIRTQIELLTKQNSSIKSTADELTNSLRLNSQARGHFGEIILENILINSGLINKNDDFEKGNYIIQKQFRDLIDSSAKPKPDAVVYFPDNKHLIIDSKCPLNNFQDFINSADDQVKQACLKEFYSSVDKMISELSNKYNNLEGLNTPEFKLMFIPIEACITYLYSNQNLILQASKNNIILVGPSTLLATLKVIKQSWVHKNHETSMNEVLKQATSIYDKFAIFLKKMEDLNGNFRSVQNGFEGVFTSLKGRGGLIGQIDKFKELGLQTNRSIDTKYISSSETGETIS